MSTRSPSQRVYFDVFEADLRAGELRKHGIKIKLHHQPFQILTLLLAHPGELVTREELKGKLWPDDTFVDFDVGLNSAVKKLRDALGDSAEVPRFVETIPRRGYRFIGSLVDIPSPKPELSPASSVCAVVDAPPIESKLPEVGGSIVPRPARHWMLPVAAAAVGTVLILLAVLRIDGWQEKFFSKPTSLPIRSIAVLPLENLSGDPAQEYFTDGMTDALVTELAQISSLRIISRTSVMRYKGTRQPLPEIAKELNVDAIVEGTVVRSAERVRVDAQLIHASSDRHLWANTYERNLGDVVVLQSEIARSIAKAIQAQLTPQEEALLANAQSVDPQTYELYLKGLYFWNKRTDIAVGKSIDYFQQALQRDPNYALAHAGIAEAYIVRNDIPPAERFSKVKFEAGTALKIREDLAEAHNAMGMSLFSYDWNWAGAEKEFQRALTINPNYAIGHQWYGQFQKAMGRPNWATEVKRAHDLDPLSLIIGGLGQYAASGQYDQAIENDRRKLELDPDFPHSHLELGQAYELKERYGEAIAEIQKGFDLSGGEPSYLAEIGYAYALWGKRAEAASTLNRLEGLSKQRYVSPYDVALVYAALDEKDAAFDWLQKAFVLHADELVFLKFDKRLEGLHADPRYADLIRRIGLPK
jgi:TolB-like protein/DNA-binding winged helix-turn-helix (wHTH) protein/Tfp pilus assembly protein PilF